jgi:hypothetical protein
MNFLLVLGEFFTFCDWRPLWPIDTAPAQAENHRREAWVASRVVGRCWPLVRQEVTYRT